MQRRQPWRWFTSAVLLLALACESSAGRQSHASRTAAAAAGAGATQHLQAAHPMMSRPRQLLQNADSPALTPLGGMSMEALQATGYPLEQHKVVTHDGWVLNMYRIPHGKQRHSTPGPRPVVLLHHGITLSSACFTLLNANESMAYILADAGFDVWMANTRANTFSRGNYNYSYRDPEYWYHSLDEYALIDGPAQVDKALAVSGAKKLAWIGHSQGASIAYAMLSARPEMNEKISVAIHMGPVVFLDRFRSPFLSSMGRAANDQLMQMYSLGEFLWYRWIAPYVQQCRGDSLASTCIIAASLMFYGPSAFLSVDDWVLVGQTWPASVSSRNVGQWRQMLTDDKIRFQRYDFGNDCNNRTRFQETCNQEVYGSMDPPEYDLSRITAPQVILQGNLDLMAVPEDILEQRRRLTHGVLVANLLYNGYSHMDFVYSRDARHMTDVVDVLYRFSPDTF